MVKERGEDMCTWSDKKCCLVFWSSNFLDSGAKIAGSGACPELSALRYSQVHAY